MSETGYESVKRNLRRASERAAGGDGKTALAYVEAAILSGATQRDLSDWISDEEWRTICDAARIALAGGAR